MTTCIKWITGAAIVCGGVWATWQLYHAQRVGVALLTLLTRDWPAGSSPSLQTRETLVSAAELLRRGQYSEATGTLGAAEPLTDQQLAAARRFLSREKTLRQRLLRVVSAAERDGCTEREVAEVRATLQRVLAAAANNAAAEAVQHLLRAEAAVDPVKRLVEPTRTLDASELASRLAGLEPAVRLGQSAMLEGYGVVGQVLARAAWHAERNEQVEACELADLAAQLLNVPPAATAGSAVPEWFQKMACPPPSNANTAQAEAAVQLAEAAAAAESGSRVLQALVSKARSELDAAHAADAAWWAGIALQTMALDPDTSPRTPEADIGRTQ
jgi:hypothetical protein